jgi:hypothetical protein
MKIYNYEFDLFPASPDLVLRERTSFNKAPTCASGSRWQAVDPLRRSRRSRSLLRDVASLRMGPKKPIEPTSVNSLSAYLLLMTDKPIAMPIATWTERALLLACAVSRHSAVVRRPVIARRAAPYLARLRSQLPLAPSGRLRPIPLRALSSLFSCEAWQLESGCGSGEPNPPQTDELEIDDILEGGLRRRPIGCCHGAMMTRRSVQKLNDSSEAASIKGDLRAMRWASTRFLPSNRDQQTPMPSMALLQLKRTHRAAAT